MYFQQHTNKIAYSTRIFTILLIFITILLKMLHSKIILKFYYNYN